MTPESIAGWVAWLQPRVLAVQAGLLVVLVARALPALPWVVFFAVALLLRDTAAGAYGALAIALIPQHAQWSNTGAAEPSAAFFTALAVMSAIAFCRNRSAELLALTAVAVAFAAHFRPESIAVLPLAFGIVWLLAPSELRMRRFQFACGAVVILVSALRSN